MLVQLLTAKGVNMLARTDEDCNAEIFSISDWPAVAKCVHKMPAPCKIPCTEDLQEMATAWNNTITVTAKGAIILRFSWPKPVTWTSRHASMALQASNMVCQLVGNCC